MRAPHLTPPIELYLPGGLTAHYVPESDPPAYRLDTIGCDLPVDVIVPDDLARLGWYWHGSFLCWAGDGPAGQIAISTDTFPVPGWPSERRNCFEVARTFNLTAPLPAPVKAPKQARQPKTKQPAAPVQLAMEF